MLKWNETTESFSKKCNKTVLFWTNRLHDIVANFLHAHWLHNVANWLLKSRFAGFFFCLWTYLLLSTSSTINYFINKRLHSNQEMNLFSVKKIIQFLCWTDLNLLLRNNDWLINTLIANNIKFVIPFKNLINCKDFLHG